MESADDRSLAAEDLLRLLERRACRRYERTDFFQRDDGVDNDLAGNLAFQVLHRLGVTLIGYGNHDELSLFYRLHVREADKLAGAHFRLELGNDVLRLLGIARADDYLDARSG